MDLKKVSDLFVESLALNFTTTAFPSTYLGNRDSVANHAYRTALYAYLFSLERKKNPLPAVITALFNNLTKTRVPEQTHENKSYTILSRDKILADQLTLLPKEVGEKIVAAYDVENQEYVDAKYLSIYLEMKMLEEKGFHVDLNKIDELFRPDSTALKQLKDGGSADHQDKKIVDEISIDPALLKKIRSSSLMNWHTQYDPMLRLVYEIFALCHYPRTGLRLAGIKSESVAEHSIRCALIAFILAELDNQESMSALIAMLVHDLPEIRGGDRNALSVKYLGPEDAKGVFKEQLAKLPQFSDLLLALETVHTNPICKDADMLEHVIETRYYECLGIKSMKNWPEYLKSKITTKSAKDIFSLLLKEDPTRWWYGKGKFVDVEHLMYGHWE